MPQMSPMSWMMISVAPTSIIIMMFMMTQLNSQKPKTQMNQSNTKMMKKWLW